MKDENENPDQVIDVDFIPHTLSIYIEVMMNILILGELLESSIFIVCFRSTIRGISAAFR